MGLIQIASHGEWALARHTIKDDEDARVFVLTRGATIIGIYCNITNALSALDKETSYGRTE